MSYKTRDELNHEFELSQPYCYRCDRFRIACICKAMNTPRKPTLSKRVAECFVASNAKIARLERTVAELREYAWHKKDCSWWQTMAPGCTCGLDALLARLDGSKP